MWNCETILFTEETQETEDTERLQMKLKNTEETKRCQKRRLENNMIYKNPSNGKIQKIREAITKTVVVSPDPARIRKQLFQLAREVRTIVGFDKPIDDTYKKVVENWHKQSGIHLEDESIDILWAQFKTSWTKIKYSTDNEIFWKLSNIAEQSQYPPICNDYHDVAKDLIRLCAVLDAYWSPEPFYLSCRMATYEFGYSHAKMATLLQLLVMNEVLELVQQGKLIGSAGQTGRASRYRFLADNSISLYSYAEWLHGKDKEVQNGTHTES